MIKIFTACYPAVCPTETRNSFLADLMKDVNAHLKFCKLTSKQVKWLQSMSKDRVILTAIVG